jgi:hypothetical protein
MKILIACEFSGTVRDAFARRGHDAWSCDLLPTEKPGNHFHYLPPTADRWKLRSMTYEGIAEAMAEQWGNTPEIEKRA